MFKELKKIWNEAKMYVKDDDTIKMPPATFENEHETNQINLISQKSESDTGCPPPSFGGNDHLGTFIDTKIATLVAEMNRVGIHTTCSCQGHDGGEAYVSIRLGEGTTYLYRKDIFGPGQDELTLRWKINK